MITNRRSPAMRAATWLMTLAYILPLLGLYTRPAHAQTDQALHVIVSDFINKGKYGGDQLAIQATAAVSDELVNTGGSRFIPYTTQEIFQTAKRLGIRTPSLAGQPAYFSRTELLRIAKDVGAEAIVEGEVGTPAPVKNRAGSVQLGVRILDVAAQEYINGGFYSAKAEPRPGQTPEAEEQITQAITDASLNVVREVVQRQQVSATVLQRIGDTIVLNRGLRDGIREGDNLVVVRETVKGGRVKQGLLRVVRSYATDAEAEVRNEVGAIRPEDIARILYTQNWVITTGGIGTGVTRSARPLNFSLIGSTLAALGIGVLIAEGARSGQTSITGVVAEPTTASDGTPEVRVKWRDNIFGQGNVVQYHIYRKPDFPYSPNVVSGTNSGGSGGTSGGSSSTLVIGAFPVGVTSGNDHTFYDQFGQYNPFYNGLTIIIGVAASALNTNGSSSGSSGGTGSNTNQGCGAFIYPRTTTTTTTNPYPLYFGFNVGTSYTYQVTAIIQRQAAPTSTGSTGSSGSTGSAGGSTGTGGTGNNGGTGNTGSNSSGIQCIETDPSESGLATPLDPVTLSAPATTDRVNLKQFSVTYTTVLGADLYQLEVSTDPRFSNPNRIFRQQFIGLSPSNITSQTYPAVNQATIDLTTQSTLLSDPTFANFVNGTTSTAPTLYVRIGARHDEDGPGPVNVFDPNNSDSSIRDFRFIYNSGVINALTNTYNGAAGSGGTGVPPPPGTKAASLLNASSPTRVGGRSTLPLPLPGQSVRNRSSVGGGSAIQSILGGGQRRH